MNEIFLLITGFVVGGVVVAIAAGLYGFQAGYGKALRDTSGLWRKLFQGAEQ